MKKISLFILCLAALNSFGQIKLGVQAGYNNSKLTGPGGDYLSTDNPSITSSAINSFQGGLLLEINSKRKMFLQTGINITGKGGFVKDYAIADNTSETTTKLWYLQIPLNFGGKINLSKNLQAISGIGLYMARGLSGSEKGSGSGFGGIYPINNKVHFTNDANYYKSNTTPIKPFDFGYNVLAGVEYKKLQFAFNYSHGFVNVYPGNYSTFKNQVFNFSVAYFIPVK